MENLEVNNIYELKNAYIKNKHNDNMYGKQKLMIIEFTNKKRIIIDLIGGLDITNIDYLEPILKNGETKVKKIFKKN